MTPTQRLLDEVSRWLFIYSGLIGLTFVVLYRWRSGGQWRKWRETRHLLRITLALSLVCLLTGSATWLVQWGVPVSALLVAELMLATVIAVEVTNRLVIMLSRTDDDKKPLITNADSDVLDDDEASKPEPKGDPEVPKSP